MSLSIGDDAALLTPDVVVSTDSSVRGVHFRDEFASLTQLSRRATLAALSDLSAMGAAPVAIFSSLILPREFSDAALEQIIEGVATAAEDAGAAVAGGNLSAGPLSFNTTVVGRQSRVLTRSGARPGDHIYVTGNPGYSALGLQQLLSGTPASSTYIDAWREPPRRFQEGRALVGVATSCIDISDGLLADLEQLCEASNVSAVIDTQNFDLEPAFLNAAAAAGQDAWDLTLGGGEAYELLFTAPTLPPIPARRIGVVGTDRDAARRVEVRGQTYDPAAGGYDHFGES